jgi:hypothetical protein
VLSWSLQDRELDEWEDNPEQFQHQAMDTGTGADLRACAQNLLEALLKVHSRALMTRSMRLPSFSLNFLFLLNVNTSDTQQYWRLALLYPAQWSTLWLQNLPWLFQKKREVLGVLTGSYWGNFIADSMDMSTDGGMGQSLDIIHLLPLLVGTKGAVYT